MGLFEKFRQGLKRSRLVHDLKRILTGSPKLDEETLEDLEATLIGADLGMSMTMEIVDAIRRAYESQGQGSMDVLEIARNVVRESLDSQDTGLKTPEGRPAIISVVGVNGTGKTTTSAKLAARFKGEGTINGQNDENGEPYKFMIWAGDGSPDTFRIRIWSEDASGNETDVYDNGFDQALGGGSIRIHRREMQSAVFRVLGIEEEEAEQKFGFLLNALRYGCPPHGGIALGLDRIIAILTGENSIREVIAFPKTQRGQDLLMDAPSVVAEEQLDEGSAGGGGALLTLTLDAFQLAQLPQVELVQLVDLVVIVGHLVELDGLVERPLLLPLHRLDQQRTRLFFALRHALLLPLLCGLLLRLRLLALLDRFASLSRDEDRLEHWLARTSGRVA